MKRMDLLWQRFWKLLVKGFWWIIWEKSKKKTTWICICDCWTETTVVNWNLRNWHTQSCWCENKINFNHRKHWMTKTKIHLVRILLRRRCNNKNDTAYSNYWGRWITYDPRREKFENFYEDMWSTYQQWLEIDRKDNNWNYCKENCRRVTMITNQNNKRTNHFIEYNWELFTIANLARKLNIKYGCLYSREYRKIKKTRPPKPLTQAHWGG